MSSWYELEKEKAWGKLRDRLWQKVRETCQDDEEAWGVINDICEYGLQSGIVGSLITYNDLCKEYDEYKDQLWYVLCDIADEMGQTPLQVINNNDICDHEELAAAIVWTVYEAIANRMWEEEW